MRTTLLRPRDWSSQPRQAHGDYKSTLLRSQSQPLVRLPPGAGEHAGPTLRPADVLAAHADLTRNASASGEAIGERIIVAGRVLEEDGRPLRKALVEVWQANAAGRYAHERDQHDAPLDPNFLGVGHVLTDSEGRYRFTTIRPGAYPWRNHANAWRPAHIHFSVFGRAFAQRLVTQMYFPGDPLLPLDPIYNATADEAARARLVAGFSQRLTEPEWALGYMFDIVLRGSAATPMED